MTSFEFSDLDNAQFKGLAKKCNLLAVPLILIGLYHLSHAAFPLLYSEATHLLPSYFIIMAVVDIFGLIAAYFLICASKSYVAIAKTQGADIQLLIIGNEQLRLALNCLCITIFLYSARYVIGTIALAPIVQS
jgi:hypothetical protein